MTTAKWDSETWTWSRPRRKPRRGGWYTWVSFGSGPAPARGPFHSEAEAEAALTRFRERYGYLAGTYEAAGTVRLYGPFTSRERAKSADISGPTRDAS